MKYYKITEVADMFSITRETVRNWIKSGALNVVYVNGRPRISEKECKRIVKEKRGE